MKKDNINKEQNRYKNQFKKEDLKDRWNNKNGFKFI